MSGQKSGLGKGPQPNVRHVDRGDPWIDATTPSTTELHKPSKDKGDPSPDGSTASTQLHPRFVDKGDPDTEAFKGSTTQVHVPLNPVDPADDDDDETKKRQEEKAEQNAQKGDAIGEQTEHFVKETEKPPKNNERVAAAARSIRER